MVKVVNERSTGFVITSRELARDKRISFKARGLFLYMWDQADNWHFYISEIADHSDKDGVDAVRSGIKELIEAGYLKIIDLHDEKGHFAGKEWHLRDSLSKEWSFEEKTRKSKKKAPKKTEKKKKETKKEPKQEPVKEQTQLVEKVARGNQREPSELLKMMVKDHFTAQANDLGREDAELSDEMLIKITLLVEEKHLEGRIASMIDTSLKNSKDAAEGGYPAGYLLKMIRNTDEIQHGNTIL